MCASAGCAAGRRSSTCPATTPTSAPSTCSSCAAGRSRRRSPTTTCCEPGERVLVAVSGGKDSLAVWDLLVELGYEADGLYIGLGIGDYSDVSGRYARDFAAARGLHAAHDRPARRPRLRRADGGAGRPAACRARRAGCRSATCSTRPPATAATTSSPPATTSTTRRPCCSATRCAGTSTTWPASCRCLPAGDGFPRKVKPLVRLTERETAAWCIVRGIDYQVEECPMAAGNKHLGYKATLNQLEAASPGTKAAFYLGFLERMAPLLAGRSPGRRRGPRRLRPLRRRRRPAEVCAFCRLVEVAAAHEPVPVEHCRRRGAADGVGDERRPLRLGERVLLLDAKRRRYLVVLTEGGEFHSHAGFVPHADVVGRPEGAVVRSTRGAEYTVLRPTLEDFVARDAPRRPGHLPQGPGADLHARRHRPRRAGVRDRASARARCR